MVHVGARGDGLRRGREAVRAVVREDGQTHWGAARCTALTLHSQARRVGVRVSCAELCSASADPVRSSTRARSPTVLQSACAVLY